MTSGSLWNYYKDEIVNINDNHLNIQMVNHLNIKQIE